MEIYSEGLSGHYYLPTERLKELFAELLENDYTLDEIFRLFGPLMESKDSRVRK